VAADRTVEGRVVEVLPRALYRVDVGGRALVAHALTGPRRPFVRLVVGDRVVIEVSERDATRGRIVERTHRQGSL
jgi:translation initiation factor IF-1